MTEVVLYDRVYETKGENRMKTLQELKKERFELMHARYILRNEKGVDDIREIFANRIINLGAAIYDVKRKG